MVKPDSLRVKICGITQHQQALEILRLGAQMLGFICVPRSPRFIEPRQIGSIVDELSSEENRIVPAIGVFADADLEVIARTVSEGQLSGLQLHGQESPEFCAQLKSQYPDLELIKAFRVKDSQTLAQLDRYQDCVDTYLLDAYHPQALGGTGHAWDWSLLAQTRLGRPWLLAGGLNPDNVRAAVTACQPQGIDLSSGVERSPGIKDIEKVRRLFAALS